MVKQPGEVITARQSQAHQRMYPFLSVTFSVLRQQQQYLDHFPFILRVADAREGGYDLHSLHHNPSRRCTLHPCLPQPPPSCLPPPSICSSNICTFRMMFSPRTVVSSYHSNILVVITSLSRSSNSRVLFLLRILFYSISTMENFTKIPCNPISLIWSNLTKISIFPPNPNICTLDSD